MSLTRIKKTGQPLVTPASERKINLKIDPSLFRVCERASAHAHGLPEREPRSPTTRRAWLRQAGALTAAGGSCGRGPWGKNDRTARGPCKLWWRSP